MSTNTAPTHLIAPESALHQVSREELANLLVVRHEQKLQEQAKAFQAQIDVKVKVIEGLVKAAYAKFYSSLVESVKLAVEAWHKALGEIPGYEVLGTCYNAFAPEEVTISLHGVSAAASQGALWNHYASHGQPGHFGSTFNLFWQQALEEADGGDSSKRSSHEKLPDFLEVYTSVRQADDKRTNLTILLLPEVPTDAIDKEALGAAWKEYTQLMKQHLSIDSELSEVHSGSMKRKALATLTAYALKSSSFDDALPSLDFNAGGLLFPEIKSDKLDG